ncbi:MAG: adenosylmethionine--8-amino-7-oxononanoate transaminase [Bacteroidetes bacterium]|nr:adenosylmethionine--8-amino-7-oxononanoate transaminase [Bacteroidota bacterium]
MKKIFSGLNTPGKERGKRNRVWYPYTRMKDPALFPCISSGSGARLTDTRGKEYIDAISSWWTNTHGHCHPHISEMIAKQVTRLDHVIFAGYTHMPAEILAERLIKKLPAGQEKIFFSDDGSTAVEVALKMAVNYWYNRNKPRWKFIAFLGGYHGDTFGAMSVSHRGIFTRPFNPLLFNAVFIDAPVKGKEERCINRMKSILSGKSSGIAAFIFEPLVQGAGGMVMYEPEPLNELLRLCRNKGVITIADEVMTGFGRSGKFFAVDYLREKPDIMCLSKGLTGGAMAMGITSCNGKIFNAFLSDDPAKTFFHGHSYTANPVACSAAIASLDMMDRQRTWKKIAIITKKNAAFAVKISGHKSIKDARSRGTILAIEVRTGNKTGYLNPFRDYAIRWFRKKGILIRPLGNVLYIMPPFCIESKDLQHVYGSIERFLDNHERLTG